MNKTNIANYDSEEEINLQFLLNIALRNKLFIFIITFTGSFLAVLYSFQVRPLYKGQFQVVVENKKEDSNSLQETILGEISGIGESSSASKTQEFILKSPFVLKPVYNSAISKYKERNDKKQNFTFKGWRNERLDIYFEKGTSVLNINFIDHEKDFIIETLNLISQKYQEYARKSERKNLINAVKFLKTQRNNLKTKSIDSLKKLNEFTIENGLGNIDGFISLGVRKNQIDTKSLNIENLIGDSSNFNKLIKDQLPDNLSTRSNQRYDNQFALLKKYEAEYLDYSSNLKPNSEFLTLLKAKIENLKSELKRPNEILIKYRELSQKADRDETLLNKVEDELVLTQIELAKQKDPWETIFNPYVNQTKISPQRSKFLIFGFSVSLIFGYFLALLKEKKSGIIYELEDLKRNINCEYLETLNLKEIELSRQLLLSLTHKTIEKDIKGSEKIGYLKLGCPDNIKDSEKFKTLIHNTKNILLTKFDESERIKNCKHLFLFFEKNSIDFNSLKTINKYLILHQDKVKGWFYIN